MSDRWRSRGSGVVVSYHPQHCNCKGSTDAPTKGSAPSANAALISGNKYSPAETVAETITKSTNERRNRNMHANNVLCYIFFAAVLGTLWIATL